MQIELEQNEINTLTALIDVAIKAGGLQTAEAGLYFVNKLKQPIPTVEKTNEE